LIAYWLDFQKMLLSLFPNLTALFRTQVRQKMRLFLILAGFLLLSPVLTSLTVPAQAPAPQVKSLETNDAGIPVLVMHLPDWQKAKQSAIFTNSIAGLEVVLGKRPALDAIDFVPGTEAVTATYEAGKLVIIEFPSPAASVEADTKINQVLAAGGDGSQTVYRRIGNYNAFVFDVTNPEAAAGLLDQVKYEKSIQWLGKDPFYYNRAERNFVVTTSDIFLSTVLVIIMGMGFSVVAGLGFGVVFFYLRDQKRSQMSEYSDAGGMTRLNLDHLTPDISPDRLLKD
jgi:hypothetical protein